MESTTDIKCNICQKSFPEQLFIVHQRMHSEHPFIFFHPCNLCDKSFFLVSDLKKHKGIHTSENHYSCEVCKKSFADNSNLIKHKRIHTEETPYSCEICKKSFSDSLIMRQHQKSSAHLKRKKSLNTNLIINEKSFADNSNLLKQKRRIYSEEKPYSCEICKKSFSDSLILRQHQKSAAHWLRQKSLNSNSNSNTHNYVDCGEDIKEELNEVESVEDPLSLQLDNQTNHEEENSCDYDYDKIDIDDMKLEAIEKE